MTIEHKITEKFYYTAFSIRFFRYCPKKCVSSKVLIFVVNKKNQRKNNEAYK